MSNRIRLIAITGPTASGKTEIGLNIARKFDGEIISVDSMQIYRWMDIGTAKPSKEMQAEVPHHLIDILNPDESYNAGKFVNDAEKIITKLHAQGKPVLLLGGTNLYLRSLIWGIIPVPAISTEVKKEIKELMAKEGLKGCFKRLGQLDPQSAKKLHCNDISRVSRALEVVLETGESIIDFQEKYRLSEPKYDVLTIGANWQRQTLYERINERVLRMIDEGLIEEAENLLWRGFNPDIPSLNSIGYRQSFQYLNDQIDYDEMIADIQQKSRQYAKKQITWNKKNQEIQWLENNHVTPETNAIIENFLMS